MRHRFDYDWIWLPWATDRAEGKLPSVRAMPGKAVVQMDLPAPAGSGVLLASSMDMHHPDSGTVVSSGVPWLRQGDRAAVRRRHGKRVANFYDGHGSSPDRLLVFLGAAGGKFDAFGRDNCAPVPVQVEVSIAMYASSERPSEWRASPGNVIVRCPGVRASEGGIMLAEGSVPLPAVVEAFKVGALSEGASIEDGQKVVVQSGAMLPVCLGDGSDDYYVVGEPFVLAVVGDGE